MRMVRINQMILHALPLKRIFHRTSLYFGVMIIVFVCTLNIYKLRIKPIVNSAKENLELRLYSNLQSKGNYCFNGTYKYEKGMNILTLITTLNENELLEDIHLNTLQNWAQFIPQIRLILYMEDVKCKLCKVASKLGWKVRKIPSVTGQGLPIFKSLLFEAEQEFKSIYTGYSNADILYDEGILHLLQTIQSLQAYDQEHFIVGRRRNYNISNCSEVHNPQDSVASSCTEHKILYKVEDVHKAGMKHGELFIYDAIDYFIFPTHSLRWELIPDFVVGRVGYDNWLLVMVQKWNMTLVDASRAVVALHQTSQLGNFAGASSYQERFNMDLIEKGFDFNTGTTKCSPVVAIYGDDLEKISTRPVPYEVKQDEFVRMPDDGQIFDLNERKGLCLVMKETPSKCPTQELHRKWLYG